MITKEIKVTNRLGLHARASSKLVKSIQGYKSKITISFRDREINAKSIMGLMMLAAGQGSLLTLCVEGPDEAEATETIVQLFGDHFGEPV